MRIAGHYILYQAFALVAMRAFSLDAIRIVGVLARLFNLVMLLSFTALFGATTLTPISRRFPIVVVRFATEIVIGLLRPLSPCFLAE